ncbi:alpha/beta fold hydrolase [Lactobacillus equicursoris]|uniref:Proline iminopeptidase n=2 Tax=Lactobacillus equicursoris TaxID=420645 RepID=A0A844FPM7_9LACO|nr:alpha/beta fold hydrolase [Lactobacillus equicursoris]
MQITEKYLPFGQYQTYCRIVGAKTAKAPLVLLHGGPGSTHNYFEVLDQVAEMSDRQVIMYDQLGCGKSSIPDDQAEVAYTAQNWVKELENLREQLGLDEIHLLGQSWGGMLALTYLISYHAPGIKSLILSSTLSSAKLWSQELHRLIKYLPEEDQAAIAQAEASGNYSNPAYQKANQLFMDQHAIKLTPDLPEPVLRKKKGGSAAYLTAWGPNEYTPIGNLHDYEYTDQLKDLTLPVLITSGTNDLCTPLVAKTMYDHLPQAKWELLAGCGHMPFVQDNAHYCQLLSDWLLAND